MALSATTHLNFPGTARAALDFYAETFGGHVVLNTYADFGMPAEAPGSDQIVFGLLVAPSGVRLMAYDIPGATQAPVAGSTRRENGLTFTDQPFFVALASDALDDLTDAWQRLTDGAHVIEPLAPSAWSPGFGMLTDRFGVTWTFSVVATPPA